MGQATVDLPESAPKTDAASNSADDLLSQLAGQEIDRLLADADTKGTVAVTPAPPIEELDLKDPPTPIAAEPVQQAHSPEPVAEKTPPAATEPTAAPAKDDGYAEQVDELFKQLKMTPGAEAPAAAPSPVEAPPAPAITEQFTSAAEKAALAPAAPIEEATVQQVLEHVDSVQRAPLYVRALELLNSPFNFCPDELRDTLGKVAILTTMNALGVLLYVMLFKRH